MEFRIVGSTLQPVSRSDSFEFANVEAKFIARTPHFEMVRHTLRRGAYFTLRPNVESDKTSECCVVESGEVEVQVGFEKRTLRAGDLLTPLNLSDFVTFHATTEAEILYLSSEPLYDWYRDLLVRLRRLSDDIALRDGYTAEHCDRILNLSMEIGRELGLSAGELFDLQYGSYLHDVGKTKIPESILQKPGPLTPTEWEMMKTHPTSGRELLSELGQWFLTGASIIVEQHHERYNGSGYPYGLRGEQIHIGAAVVAVADSFDAMTSVRTYQPLKSFEVACAEIRQLSGVLYHPQVVDAFLRVVHAEHVGVIVR